MGSVGVFPALALVAGAVFGLVVGLRLPMWCLPAAAGAAWCCWWFSARCLPAVIIVAYVCAGAILSADAREKALHTSLRDVLDREFGGFAMEAPGTSSRHEPVRIRARILEDAAPEDDVTVVRALVTGVRLRDGWRSVKGGVTFTIGGQASYEYAREWTAGRTIETFAAFRRPARYLNDGARDFERELALDGTTLFGSVKSGLLVDIRDRGSPIDEAAATVRRLTRQRIDRWIGRYDPVSAAIVTAVLIGDRSALPEDIRLRLQAAGTYHVIAISGGNIAILAALILALLLVCGVAGRPAALAAIILLVAYAQIVTSGPSVWRATLMAIVYLSARLLDHRTPPWQAIAVAAGVMICVRPLDVRDAGFLLTFGATAALLETARLALGSTRRRLSAWVVASIVASIAVEVALLPVSAWAFSRVTSAGLVLNLVAIPLMGVVQVGGMAVVLLDRVGTLAGPAAWVAHTAASALVGSARLVDVAPWLTARVPPPSIWLVVLYYAALCSALVAPGRLRIVGLAALAISGAGIVAGRPWPLAPATGDPAALLRFTVFDVGQGESTLVQFPDQTTLLVDTGGLPFGGGFDIGSRVLAPALWARGIRRLDMLLLTHGDPDHIGGAEAVLDDFAPARLWEGIPVPTHPGLQRIIKRARQRGTTVVQKTAGNHVSVGAVRVRVLHPPLPDWQRRRVRNDDSVVLELMYGEVAVLLAGDIGASVEESILQNLTPARVRILKVAHHGSRTSTSQALLDRWRPQVALISCGRGNTFGHPAPEVLERLESAGVVVYRTDLDGQITLDTDGHHVRVRTFVPRSPYGAKP